MQQPAFSLINVDGMSVISLVADPELQPLSSIFDTVGKGIILVDDSGEINLANGNALAKLGYTVDKLDRALLFTVNPHLTLLSWKKIWKQVLSGATLEEETEYMHQNGALLPVETRTSLLEFGGRNWALIGVEFLLESRRFPDMLKVAAEVGKLCTWELNLVNKELMIYGATDEILGLPQGTNNFGTERIDQVFVEHLNDKDYQRLNELVKNLISTGQAFETIVIFNHQDQSFDHLQIQGWALQSESQTSKIYGTIKKAFQVEDGDEARFLSQFSLDKVSDLIFWVRTDGSFAYVNQAVCERLGYTRKELMKMSSLQITYGFEPGQRVDLWERLRREKHLEGKFELITKSGEIVPVLSTNSYLQYEGEEYNCAFSKDISRQERETRRLKLTQFSVENSHEMMLWINPEGGIIYVNAVFSEKTGYSKQDCKQLNFYDLLAMENVLQIKDDWWRQLTQEGEFELEAELWKKDGKLLPINCFFNYIEYEGQELVCMYVRDWSRKKKREVQLFLAQNALDSAQDMIFWIDQDLRIAYKNVAAREKLGYRPGELKGAEFKKVCRELDLQAILDSSSKATFETDFYTKNRTKIPVEVSISPAEFKGNRYSCMIVRDITERRKSQEKLAENQDKIRELSLKLKDENILLKEEITMNYNFNNIVTQDKNYRKVLSQIAQVADSDATVLILGETGTGKELLARAIYSLSEREDRPFIKVNCAALPENLIESELFGHEKGAFTGAIQQKKGRFELANKGTLFLDEIGELPLDLQAKLLRVLQEGEFERLGGTATLKVDVRIVAATNRNLEEMVEEGTFREDLFYRLNVFPISNPPLRERKDDVPLLVKHFVRKYGERMGKKVDRIPQADLDRLQKYDFPGNIRELENMVERAMILAQDGVLNLKASFDLVRDQVGSKSKENDKFFTFEEMQKEHIVDALKRCNFRVTGPNGAARLLDLNDRTLMSKMRKLNIRREDYL